MTGDGYAAVSSEEPNLDDSQSSAEGVHIVPTSGYERDDTGPRTSDMGIHRTLQLGQLEAVKAFVKGNAGLLLVMFAQLFFAVMDVSVKQLHSLNEPVPTLEVNDFGPDIIIFADDMIGRF